MLRLFALIYGVVGYGAFLASSLYAFLALGGYLPGSPFRGERAFSWVNLLIDAGLLGIFAAQHSVMARPWFKRWWTQFVPQPIERSTYVLFSAAALVLLVAMWQPVGGVIWEVQSPVARGVLLAISAGGWMIVVASSWMINHFDLFGLRQVWLYYQGKPYTSLPFTTPAAYAWVRHPIYIGWLTAFWATPTMTIAHFVFAAGTTVYILAAIRWEEADLLEYFGEHYAKYRRCVPMLFPWPPAKEVNEGCVPSDSLRKTIGKA
jgi:protein-S-isoprenylcysteine O-methyltransferase Ste14